MRLASQHGDGLITDAERDIPLDQVYGAWPASADPQIHIQGIQKLIEGGVTHIFVHSPQPDQHQVIEFYGREVLPQRRHGSPAGDQSRLDPSLLAGQPPETQAHPS